MSTLLAIGLANAACAAVLAIPALLVSRYARRPALAHALWLLVLLKLVTPPLFRPHLPWLPQSVPVQAAAVADDPPPLPFVLPAMAPPAQVEPPMPAVLVAAMPVSVTTPPTTVPTVSVAPPADDRDPWTLLLVVWLVGVGIYLGRSLLLVWRFQRLLGHARPAPEGLQAQAAEVARELGLRRCPSVWLVPGALPPMVWGVGRVRVLFPAGLAERLSPQECRSLLAHELAHVVRRDHWVRWLELAALTLYWWYPLAWWARWQMQAREEECCDAWAAAQAEPRVYANAILDAVDFLAEARPRPPAIASPLARRSSLKGRLTLIMTGPGPRRLAGPTRLALAVLAVAVLPLLPALVRSDAASPPVADARTADADEAEPGQFASAQVNLLRRDLDTSSVAFSDDGARIAAGDGGHFRSGHVSVWDARTRQLLWSRAEPSGVSSVSFSAGGKRLAWSGWRLPVRVRDLTLGRDLVSLALPARNSRVTHSPDGQWLAVASEDRWLRLLDARTGRLAHTLQGDLVDFYCVNFSPDSRYVAAGGGYFNRAEMSRTLVWDLLTRRQVARLEGHLRAVTNVAFAPRNVLMATASADNTVRVFDGKSFKLRVVLTGHTQGVKGLAFSPDGKVLATGSWDRTIRLWDPVAGKQLAQLDGHPGMVREIAFSPDGKWLVSGGERRTVKLWDVAARKELATLRQDGSPQTPPAPLTLGVWDVEGGQQLVRFDGHRNRVWRVAVSPDSRRLLRASGGATQGGKPVAGSDFAVRLWPTPGRAVVARVRGE